MCTVHIETDCCSDEELTELPRVAKGKGKAKEGGKEEFLPRIDTPWKIGAHVSSAGGVENAVLNASYIG